MKSTFRHLRIILFCLVFAPTFVFCQSLTDNQPIRINAGGPEIHFDEVIFESGDAYTHLTNGYTYAPDLSDFDIANTEWDEIYKTETSFKDLEYNIPVQDNACYEIRLHFAEIFFGAPGGGTGSEWGRIFDVVVEDEMKIDDYNISKVEGGPLHAAVYSYEVCLEEGNHEINLYFPARSDNAKISAIEILPVCTGDCSEETPFPVELVNFEATVEQQSVILTWMTAWEENNAYFELQRASGDKNFTPITQIAGHGHADVVSTYEVKDISPISGRNYYRLKQVDVDGNFTFSPIIELEVSSLKKAFNVYPNPAQKTATVILDFEGFSPNKNVNVYVRDLNGQIVQHLKITPNTYIGTHKTSYEYLQRLSSGIYIISVDDGSMAQAQRFIVL